MVPGDVVGEVPVVDVVEGPVVEVPLVEPGVTGVGRVAGEDDGMVPGPEAPVVPVVPPIVPAVPVVPPIPAVPPMVSRLPDLLPMPSLLASPVSPWSSPSAMA